MAANCFPIDCARLARLSSTAEYDSLANCANYALDTMGVPPVFAQMINSLVTRGHGALVGAAKLGTEAPFDIGTWLLSGIKVGMVVEGDAVPREFIPCLVGLHQQGLFPFDKLTKKHVFEGAKQVFAASPDGSMLKPIMFLYTQSVCKDND